MVIPENWHFLLEFSDGQLVEEALANKNGYALAILQERQHQDIMFIEEFDPGCQQYLFETQEIRQRIKWRRKKLALVQKLFNSGILQLPLF